MPQPGRWLPGSRCRQPGRRSRDGGRSHRDVLVALGGDGLVSLAMQAVAGTSVALGIVAGGTGNDVARTLAIPADPLAAADVVLAGRLRTVDLGRVGQRKLPARG